MGQSRHWLACRSPRKPRERRAGLSPAVTYVSALAAQSLTERWQLLRRKEGPEERMYGQHSRSSPPLQGPIQSGWLRRTAQVQCRDAATGWRGVTVFWSRGRALLQGGEDTLGFLWFGGFVAVVPFLFVCLATRTSDVITPTIKGHPPKASLTSPKRPPQSSATIFSPLVDLFPFLPPAPQLYRDTIEI